ncbi:MAG TPA: tRNA (adenosine(37)-N6)-dimethylallyltransferase MiaA [Clostridia bacterium]|nr:tRNA (adenosine(37)-N6)-dimethylallyltransferase MiaA [Clostridia bacterium]
MYSLAVIAGPTAVGKSAVAVEVAALIGGEIISADSAQVYRGMDIGTAKVTREEMYASDGQFIPHHLLSILPPDARFSVADFRERVDKLIPEIAARGKIPMLVGGTGLYIEGVIDPYQFSPLAFDADLRQKLTDEARRLGKAYLHRQLAEVDPVSASKIHPNDLKRVIRALEVYYLTGVPISQAGQRSPGRGESRYRLCYVGLTADRDYLYRRINQRVDAMMAQGFVEEVKALLHQGYSPELPALQSLGYRQIIGYLQGKYDLATAVNLIKRDTRRFAKRQLTWFRRDPRIIWFNVQHYADKNALAAEIAAVISRSITSNVELGISN